MLQMIILLWLLIELKAPVWLFILLGLAATAKIVISTIKLMK